MISAEEAGLRLHAQKRNPTNPMDPVTFTVTKGTRTETLKMGRGAGGIIEEWTSADSGLGYNNQWLNHRGIAGRGFQSQVIFENQGGPTYRAVQGGCQWDGSPAPAAISDGYLVADVQQGALNILLDEHDLGSGSKLIRTRAHPMEWVSDSFINPIVYADIVIGQDIYLNWSGNTGIHRIDSIINLPNASDITDTVKIVSHTAHLRFAFDDVRVYNGSTFVDMDGVQAIAAMSHSIAALQDGGGDTLVVTTTAGHNRNAGTTHLVTFSGFTPGDINATFVATFTTPTLFNIELPGHTLDYSGGTITSPQVTFADITDNQERSGGSNHFDVVGADFINNDLTGLYRGQSKFGSDRNALIYSAIAASPNAWSFNEDFAVGLYVVNLDDHSLSLANRRQMRWASLRESGAPTNGAETLPSMVMGTQGYWGNLVQTNATTFKESAFVLTGTDAEVATSITTLDGLSL